MSDVRVWLDKKFLEWQNQMGEPMRQKQFAAYIGVKPSTYSSWVNDGVPPTGENLYKLADKLGYEIYEIVGETPPSPSVRALRRAQDAFNELSPEQQVTFLDRINQLIEQTLTEFGAKRIK